MKRSAFAVTLIVFLAAVAAQADDNLIQLHGFGGWSYGRSQNLSFLGATKAGNANNAQFALNLVAKPYERINIISQINLKSSQDNKVDLDYAFAEWMATDHVKLRVGRVKHPLGLYGEVYDVGTVRPFQYLPRSIYGEDGFTAKAYNGVGLTGTTRRGNWELLYDLYGGEIDGDYAIPFIPPGTVNPQASPFVNYGIRYRDVLGGRLQLTTPVQGLLVGLSGYRGKENFIGRTVVRTVGRDVILGSAEYGHGPLMVRAEWGRGDSRKLHVHQGGYVEASYFVRPKWQLATRYDKLTFDPVGFGTGLDAYKVKLHRDVAFGLNYWLNPNVVLRADYHTTDGNRFAYPSTNAELQTAVATGTLQSHSSALILGAQFSF